MYSPTVLPVDEPDNYYVANTIDEPEQMKKAVLCPWTSQALKVFVELSIDSPPKVAKGYLST